MARTVKARREAYDNIAVGSAISSRERTIPDLSGSVAGALPPDFTTFGNTENIAYASDYGSENVIVKTTDLLTGERVAV